MGEMGPTVNELFRVCVMGVTIIAGGLVFAIGMIGAIMIYGF